MSEYKEIPLPKGTKVSFTLPNGDIREIVVTIDHYMFLKGEELHVWEKQNERSDADSHRA